MATKGSALTSTEMKAHVATGEFYLRPVYGTPGGDTAIYVVEHFEVRRYGKRCVPTSPGPGMRPEFALQDYDETTPMIRYMDCTTGVMDVMPLATLFMDMKRNGLPRRLTLAEVKTRGMESRFRAALAQARFVLGIMAEIQEKAS